VVNDLNCFALPELVRGEFLRDAPFIGFDSENYETLIRKCYLSPTQFDKKCMFLKINSGCITPIFLELLSNYYGSPTGHKK